MLNDRAPVSEDTQSRRPVERSIDGRLWVLLILSLALTACDTEQKLLERKASAALKETLIDPTSFLVRKLARGRDARGEEAVCGEVNGKNRMGGYSGYQPFVATGSASAENLLVALLPSGSEPGLAAERRAYTILYQRFCEPGAEKAARIKAEREEQVTAEQIRKEIEAEHAKQASAEAAAKAQEQAAQKLLKSLTGDWAPTAADCLDMGPYHVTLSTGSIGIGGAGASITAVKLAGANVLNLHVNSQSTGPNPIEQIDVKVVGAGNRKIELLGRVLNKCVYDEFED